MAVATVLDVAGSLGRPITDPLEVEQVLQWLADAEMQIRARLGDVTLLDQEALAYVEREAVILKLRNPDGKVSEGIDDYTYRRNDDNARGQITILDSWWDLLTPDQATGAFSITAAGDPYVARAWSPVTGDPAWWCW